MSEDCPFCHPDERRIVWQDDHAYLVWDGFPVSPGHALAIPRRHFAEWFDATDDERKSLFRALDYAREVVAADHSPDGWNIGVNVGPAAGQTVFHLHVHLIPRFEGDVDDPRGGVRGVVPDKAQY